MATIITNMSWKATPDYNAKNGTAKEPDENGIVEFEEGAVARTDNVDIVFTDNAGKGNSDAAAQVQSDAGALKGNGRLAESMANCKPIPDEELWVAGYDRTIYRDDGSSFTLRYQYNYRESKGYDKNYLSAIAAEVNGENDKGFYCLINNLANDIVSFFSSAKSFRDDSYAVRDAIEALMTEIRQNIADGKADPAKDLQTKVTINGTEWNFSELIGTIETLNTALDDLEHTGSLDYEDYAKMGIKSAYLKDWAGKNLSEDKAAMVANAVEEKFYSYIMRQNKFLEEDAERWQSRYNTPERAEYYAYGSWMCASNVEHREAIKELFASADYSSPSKLAGIMNRYQSLMSPVFLANGATQSKLSGYLSLTVNHLYSYIAELFGTQSGVKNFSTLA